MHPADVFAFLGIVLVMTVTPGVDMALVMRTTLTGGLAATWRTIAGIATGVAVHATLSIAGVSTLLQRVDGALTIVQLGGASWLVWLGGTALWASLRPRVNSESTPPAAAVRAHSDFLRGFVTNLLNVKILLFYIAFLPQFAPEGDRFVPVAAGLALVQVVIGIAWLVVVARLTAHAGHRIGTSGSARRWIDAVTGTTLVGFGIRLALSR